MFARGFEILVGKRDAAHAKFERHVNNRDPILIEFFLRLEQTDCAAGRCGNVHVAG